MCTNYNNVLCTKIFTIKYSPTEVYSIFSDYLNYKLNHPPLIQYLLNRFKFIHLLLINKNNIYLVPNTYINKSGPTVNTPWTPATQNLDYIKEIFLYNTNLIYSN